MERSWSLNCLAEGIGAFSLAVVIGCNSNNSQTSGQSTGGENDAATGGTGGSIPATGGSGGTMPDTGIGGASGTGPVAGTGGNQALPDASAAVDAPSSDDAGGIVITDPGTEGDGTFPIAAPFKASPEMSDQPGIAKGQVIQFTMANNTTFKDGSRKVGIYVPAKYVSGTEIPFMVAQDGINPQNGGSFGLDDLRPLMDNMIAAGEIPMMAGVFVDPGNQRSLEYDTPSDKYFQFVETELLPEVINQAKMKNITLNLTTNPEGRGAFGGSSGGAAAFTMGWFHPESYRRILTISGSFVKLQTAPMFPNGCGDYHMSVIAATPIKPLRVFLEAGSMDLNLGGNLQWRPANDAMAMVLTTKGNHTRYVTSQGAGHEDDGARRQYLPAAMQWLWRGYPITKP